MAIKKPTPESLIQFGKLIYAFPILHRRKPMDDKGAIYELPDGKRYILLTSQGEFYVARPGELLNKIQEYEAAILASEVALRLFYDEDKVDSGLH